MKKPVSSALAIMMLLVGGAALGAWLYVGPQIVEWMLPMTTSRALENPGAQKRARRVRECVMPIIAEQMPYHATTAELLSAISQRARVNCIELERDRLQYVCDVMGQKRCESAEHANEKLDEACRSLLSFVDRTRREDGLPPRPSFGR